MNRIIDFDDRFVQILTKHAVKACDEIHDILNSIIEKKKVSLDDLSTLTMRNMLLVSAIDCISKHAENTLYEALNNVARSSRGLLDDDGFMDNLEAELDRIEKEFDHLRGDDEIFGDYTG